MVLFHEKRFKETSPDKEHAIITKFIPSVSIAQKNVYRMYLGRTLTDELKNPVQAASKARGATNYARKPGVNTVLSPALSFCTVYQGISVPLSRDRGQRYTGTGTRKQSTFRLQMHAKARTIYPNRKTSFKVETKKR